ncbi:class I SAM-dependent methyltransferase [Rhizobium leguminosarum]|uniref:class I SAM-dependent methyltransferase n=1 Tax=Rhizobium leguminosarum TaxID=384 RepID=UPI00197D67AD|nr:class I SAM-dependent methyltransferase [Rhizobium leguminosarum]
MITAAKTVLPKPLIEAIRGRRSPSRENLCAWDGAALQSDAERFLSSRIVADQIDGMLSPFSMAAMDSLLSLQTTNPEISGNVVEFGTYKGRSAAIIAPRVRPSEKFVLVDVADYLEVEKIRAISPAMEFVLCRSEEFRSHYPEYRQLRKNCRFIHVDSSHAYRTTFQEMKLCNELLSAGGIAVFDDYTNLNYSQVLPAIYKYIYTANPDLAVFMVTDIKAYLCRKKYLNYYLSFVLQGAIPSMVARGIEDAIISRTDWDREYRAIYLRTRSPGETGPHYGQEIYGRLYEGP